VTAELLLASNRGPLSYAEDDTGALVGRRGGGGLVSAVGGAAADALWVCAALSDADRRAARSAVGGLVEPGVQMLDMDPVTFDRAYNGVANSTLWFVAHLLYATASAPVFDARSRREWRAYRDYGDAFAAALAVA
jgi:trehalose 6-phosphate synthase